MRKNKQDTIHTLESTLGTLMNYKGKVPEKSQHNAAIKIMRARQDGYSELADKYTILYAKHGVDFENA